MILTSSNIGGSNSPITSTALGSLFAVKCIGPAACLFFFAFLLSFFSFLAFLSFFFSSDRSSTSSLISFFATFSSSFLTADYNYKIYIQMYNSYKFTKKVSLSFLKLTLSILDFDFLFSSLELSLSSTISLVIAAFVSLVFLGFLIRV